jgi:hypothetical protein
MADAQRRLAEDMADTSAPGIGEAPTTPEPSAGTQKTDTTQGQPPESIPYARFKEVNDQFREVKGFVPVAEAGYDPDSVGRLIAFEQAYQEDPTGTISSVVENMDLPDATKNAITAMLGNSEPAHVPIDQSDVPDEDPPEWAKPIIEDHASRQKAEENAYFDGLLNVAVNHWKQLDQKDGLAGETATPDKMILRQIRATIDDGEGFETMEQLAEAARSELMGYREATLGSAVANRRTGPLPMPGSGVPASSAVKFESIKDASKAAEAAIERGELPPLSP